MWQAALGGGIAAAIGLRYPAALPWLAGASILTLIGCGWYRIGYRNTSRHLLASLRKNEAKKARQRHRNLQKQIDYIARHWGWTQEQQTVVERFMAARAYDSIYDRLSASLLPQMIQMIDQCNDRERRGCKRQVGRRLRELVRLLRDETRTRHDRSREDFETTLEVYDRLL